MRVLIIGAGNTAMQLANRLIALHHEVVLVENDPEVAAQAREALDAIVIEGWGSSPTVLERAGLRQADMLVAVTGSDEVNILACAYAAEAGVAHKIARVARADYALSSVRPVVSRIGVDHLVCDNEVIAREIVSLLRLPGAVEAAEVLGGRVMLVGLRVPEGSPLAGRRLAELSSAGGVLEKVRLVGVVRGERARVPHGTTLITVGDLVYLAVCREDVDEALDWLHPSRQRCQRVVIVGGGEVGRRMACLLEEELSCSLIEKERAQAERCSEECRHTTVILGDCLEEETLVEAGVAGAAVGFAAVTGDDENNIIACVLARRLGASLTIARISRAHYPKILGALEIVDRVAGDHLAVMNAIMGYVRGRQVRASRSLDGLPGEIMEIDVTSGSRWVGRKLKALDLPRGAIVAAVQRGEAAMVPTGETTLCEGDVLVVFATPEAVARLRP